MKIATTEKSATIEKDNYNNTYPLNTLWYQKTNDGVSILQYGKCVETSPISLTTVNGEQLTPENADSLLSSLFKSNGGSGGGDEQIQSDYTEKNSSSKAYIKNKPYKELPEGTALPTTANAGDIVVFKDNNGNTVAVWKFDGFIWMQEAANYSLVYKVMTNQSQRLFNYAFKKVVDPMYYVAMLPGQSGSYIYATRIDKISRNFSVYGLTLGVEEDNANVELSEVEASFVHVLQANYNVQILANRVRLFNIASSDLRAELQAKEYEVIDIEPTTREGYQRQVSINLYADKITLKNINRPSYCYFYPQDRRNEDIIEKDFIIDVVDFKGVATESTETEYTQGSSFEMNNSGEITTHGKLTFWGDVERFTFYGFGSNYQSSDLDFYAVLQNPQIFMSLEMSFCKIVNPSKLDVFFDAIIADGTVRNNPNIGTPYINLSSIENYTLTDERKTALESLGFSVNWN